jgi:putative oxidoreductase
MNRGFQYAPLPLRLMMGFGFLYHGIPKLSVDGHAGFNQNLQGMGVPAPDIMAWAIAALEVFGGVALIVGLLTRATAALLIVEMIVAAVKVHGPNGFSIIHIIGQDANGPIFGMPGYELNLLYIAPLLSLVLSGPGHWSIDRRMRRATEHAALEAPPRMTKPQPVLHGLDR